MIPYGKHFIDEEDIASVVAVLRDGMLTQGPKVAEFEASIAKRVGSKYAVAVSSGTAALHLACMAVDLGYGDEVYTTPNTFVASSNCALYVGATPRFVDIDPSNLNIDTVDLYQRCLETDNVKAIIPVHFAGLPCDMHRIHEIGNEFNATIIEDASHALGAVYEDGSCVGNCKYSDMTVFSFHPVKGIAAGEGGMITTNDETLFQKLLKLRSHGICKGNFEFPGISFPDNTLVNPAHALEGDELKMWYYEMQDVGYNYRITDMQCALALSQMNKMDVFLARRREIAALYDKAFAGYEMLKPAQTMGRDRSSHHIYVLRVDFEGIGLTRHQLMKALVDRGVGSQVHYIPVPMQPYYESMGYSIADYPHANKYYQEALTIPIYYSLSNEDVTQVVDAIKDVCHI